MKKLFILISIISLTVCFTSCDLFVDFSSDGSPSCEHTYEWLCGKQTHQKVYTCGCPTPDIAELHTDADVNYICDICGTQLETPISQGLEFVKNNDGTNCAVKSIGTCTDKDVIVPDLYDGLPVVAILEEAFKGNTQITSVILPDSVIAVYGYAFMDCTALNRVETGKGLKFIDQCAFAGCLNLKTIELSEKLEIIYEHAFNGCASLTEIVIPDSVRVIDPWAFANCTSIQSISFSDNMMVVEESVCYGCTSLTNIDFGSGVERVKKDAFYGCISLERLYIPENIIELTSSFPSCSALNYVEFEITNGWEWASQRGFFNSKNVTNPETNANNMKWTWDGSSWKREIDN